jgi:hypothetical protein
MHKIITALFVFATLISVSACEGHPDLKSPCVGAEGSPCDRHTPANQA